MPALNVARRNAEAIILNATVYPFRLPEYTLDCVYCRETFADPSKYTPHMKREHTAFKIKTAFQHCPYQSYLKVDCSEIFCRLCEKSEQFERVDDVARHLSEEHSVKFDFDHQMGVHPFKFKQNKLLCGICDENFPCMRQLSRHMSTHYQNFTCDSCGKSYSTYDSLKQHIKAAHMTKEKNVCRKCRKSFSSLDEKRDHIEKSQNCWLYQCSVCQKRLLSWALKEEHLVQVHGHPKKSYPCPECAQTFSTRYLYRAHFNTTHGVGFVCTYCGRKFGYRRSLDQHLVVHTGAKMFPCEVCSKSFATKKSLTQHMWIHSKYKRFECKLCNKQFNQRVSYKSHMRGHHPDIPEEEWKM